MKRHIMLLVLGCCVLLAALALHATYGKVTTGFMVVLVLFVCLGFAAIATALRQALTEPQTCKESDNDLDRG